MTRQHVRIHFFCKYYYMSTITIICVTMIAVNFALIVGTAIFGCIQNEGADANKHSDETMVFIEEGGQPIVESVFAPCMGFLW